ncbi:MAG: MBOAT family protein [Atopobiaceae bacterium]|nr:MBOAT family protein [Atopobiaceae bacterium]
MVFSSLIFLSAFLPIVFALHTVVRDVRVKNAVLICASLLFYAWGEPVYIVLLLASTVVNYVFGRLVRAGGKPMRAVLVGAVVVNLAFLGVFKYADMAVSTLNAVSGANLPLPGIPLPLGISFYTFQALSYVIDVYRGACEPQASYPRVLLYISFFPQLVAGPIVKYHDIERQMGERSASVGDMADGLVRFACGLGKKVLIANTMGACADALYALDASQITAPIAWLAAFSYLMQIYFDFSGYSDMAIGLGRLFGFRFLENFDHPYASTTIKEFWRRWHISLSTWFKEYVYIPLGGNRKGRLRAGVNKCAVFFLCGLWHGASWTFVIWGLIHGAFSLMEELVPVKRLPRILGHLYTLLVVMLAFVVFRCDTLGQAGTFISSMFLGWRSSSASHVLLMRELTPLFLATAAIACIASFPVSAKLKEAAPSSALRLASYAGALALIVLSLLALSSGTYNPFIYFRF